MSENKLLEILVNASAEMADSSILLEELKLIPKHIETMIHVAPCEGADVVKVFYFTRHHKVISYQFSYYQRTSNYSDMFLEGSSFRVVNGTLLLI